jgi:hypothetical protein
MNTQLPKRRCPKLATTPTGCGSNLKVLEDWGARTERGNDGRGEVVEFKEQESKRQR